MRRAERRRLARRRAAGGIDLFPFLSLFLCILGVVGFLQVVLAVTAGRVSKLVVQRGHDGQVAWQVWCRPEGAQLIAPPDSLSALLQRLPEDPDLLRIAKARAGRGGLDVALSELNHALVRELQDVTLLNRRARESDVDYEEFLLIGMSPGGVDCFHIVHDVVHTDGLRELRMGLVALGPEMRLEAQ